MTKRQYYKLVKGIPDTKWLIDSANNPSKYMTKTHVAIINLVIRQRQQTIRYKPTMRKRLFQQIKSKGSTND